MKADRRRGGLPAPWGYRHHNKAFDSCSNNYHIAPFRGYGRVHGRAVTRPLQLSQTVRVSAQRPVAVHTRIILCIRSLSVRDGAASSDNGCRRIANPRKLQFYPLCPIRALLALIHVYLAARIHERWVRGSLWTVVGDIRVSKVSGLLTAASADQVCSKPLPRPLHHL